MEKRISDFILEILISKKNQYVKSEVLKSFYVCFNGIDFLVKINGLKLRYYIKLLRNEGHAIIANKHGYCLTTNKLKFEEYKKARFNEIASEIETLNKMEVKEDGEH